MRLNEFTSRRAIISRSISKKLKHTSNANKSMIIYETINKVDDEVPLKDFLEKRYMTKKNSASHFTSIQPSNPEINHLHSNGSMFECGSFIKLEPRTTKNEQFKISLDVSPPRPLKEAPVPQKKILAYDKENKNEVNNQNIIMNERKIELKRFKIEENKIANLNKHESSKNSIWTSKRCSKSNNIKIEENSRMGNIQNTKKDFINNNKIINSTKIDNKRKINNIKDSAKHSIRSNNSKDRTKLNSSCDVQKTNNVKDRRKSGNMNNFIKICNNNDRIKENTTKNPIKFYNTRGSTKLNIREPIKLANKVDSSKVNKSMQNTSKSIIKPIIKQTQIKTNYLKDLCNTKYDKPTIIKISDTNNTNERDNIEIMMNRTNELNLNNTNKLNKTNINDTNSIEFSEVKKVNLNDTNKFMFSGSKESNFNGTNEFSFNGTKELSFNDTNEISFNGTNEFCLNNSKELNLNNTNEIVFSESKESDLNSTNEHLFKGMEKINLSNANEFKLEDIKEEKFNKTQFIVKKQNKKKCANCIALLAKGLSTQYCPNHRK